MKVITMSQLFGIFLCSFSWAFQPHAVNRTWTNESCSNLIIPSADHLNELLLFVHSLQNMHKKNVYRRGKGKVKLAL
jgi:hypothetical protein